MTTIKAFEPVKKAGKLVEQVHQQLEQLILSGQVKVNQQLPTETELASGFGVSRTVIREAIHRLEAHGLVRARVGSGTCVIPVEKNHIKSAMERFAALNASPETFLQLLDLRQVIEAETSRRMAGSHDPAAIARVKETLVRMHSHREDRLAFAQADMAFHLAIAAASGNPFFGLMLEPLKKLGTEYGLRTYVTPEDIDRTCEEHGRILRAIEDGDAAAAGEAMQLHIASSRAHYLGLLAAEAKTSTPSGRK